MYRTLLHIRLDERSNGQIDVILIAFIINDHTFSLSTPCIAGLSFAEIKAKKNNKPSVSKIYIKTLSIVVV